jgi:hypothetical protein
MDGKTYTEEDVKEALITLTDKNSKIRISS